MKKLKVALIFLVLCVAADGLNAYSAQGCFVCGSDLDFASGGTQPICTYPQSGAWGSDHCGIVQIGPIGTPRATKFCSLSGWACLYYEVTP